MRQFTASRELHDLPGCPSNQDVAATGIARISYGPFPYRDLMKQLAENARAV